jgi:hypothetical protein
MFLTTRHSSSYQVGSKGMLVLWTHSSIFLYPRSPKAEGGILFYLCPSFRPSKIFFVAYFSVTVDGRNLIFGHKRHIGTITNTTAPTNTVIKYKNGFLKKCMYCKWYMSCNCYSVIVSLPQVSLPCFIPLELTVQILYLIVLVVQFFNSRRCDLSFFAFKTRWTVS